LVLWSSDEFSFVNLADSYCTGSSIMPQKKNPDIPELIRGKSGRVTGNLISLITMLKGLPLTYNRDLQEDKEPIFDTADTVSHSLAIMAELLDNLEFNLEILQNRVKTGFMTATDLADYLVLKQIPFRKAHSIVGRAVAHCLDNGKDLSELTLDELKGFSSVIEDDIFSLLTVKGSVDSRQSAGGTSIKSVKQALSEAEKILELKP
ncbi:MAG: argininosuccinate lyase, partial [Desulfobulbaceae bacterium]|nr:argininosuccinate lyase [Desulfobulbaceae bacterium]